MHNIFSFTHTEDLFGDPPKYLLMYCPIYPYGTIKDNDLS